MALNNRGGPPGLLSTFLNSNNNAGLDINAIQDDDVSRLSFGDNQSYICDLAFQKKNRKAMIQQEALEETQELYEVAIGEGAQKTKELFMQIFTLVEAELLESYKAKDQLLEERLEAAVLAEKERVLANKTENHKPGPGQQRVSQIDMKLQKEETKILKKKIKKIRNMVKDIMKDKEALKDDKKSKQLRRLQKKHDTLVEELGKIKKDSDSVDRASIDSSDLGLSDDDSERAPKKKKKKKKEKQLLSIDEGTTGKISAKPKKKKKSMSKVKRRSMPPIDERSGKSEKSDETSAKSETSGLKKISRNASGISTKSPASTDTEKKPRKKNVGRNVSGISSKSSGTSETERT